jgi:hypothetical protein
MRNLAAEADNPIRSSRILPATVLIAVLTMLTGEAVADCMSNCSSAYYSCVRGFGERDCATTRSICQNRCVISGSGAYGAIAYSPSTGAHGYSYRQGSRSAAERRALRECRNYAKAGDCRVEVWYSNNCGALAVGSGTARGSAYAANAAAASAAALRYCRSRNGGRACVIKRATCSR